MVVPVGNVAPGKCDFVHIRLPDAVQLSIAVGSVHETTAEQPPAPAVRVMLAGQPLITGACVSFTVTVNEHCVVLLAASIAVTVTVVSPTLNVFVPI